MNAEEMEEKSKAPFAAGELPAAGWFAVEPACRWEPKDQEALKKALGLAEDAPDVEAVLDEEGLRGLTREFSLPETDNAGLPVSRNHDFGEALGWAKDLAADGGMLWAWIEWTPAGHEAVNGGGFKFFSTEYEYEDFRLREDGACEPCRLAGLSVTNYPNHAGQVPMTNSRATGEQQEREDMKPRLKKRALPLLGRTRDVNASAPVAADEKTEEAA